MPALASASPARTRLDGELGFWFGDDDVLHDAEQTLPTSPVPSFGERTNYTLALDELSDRASRRQRSLVLELGVLDAASAETASGAAVARFGVEPSGDPARPALGWFDAGSYLELSLQTRRRYRLRLFPLAGDALRLGFLEPLTWGGKAGPLGESPYSAASDPVPALSLSSEGPLISGFVAAKTALMNVPSASGPEREQVQYGLFAGAGLRPVRPFEFDLQAGLFEHGALPQPDVRGQRLYTAGVSARVLFLQRQEVPRVPGLFPAPGRPRAASEQELDPAPHWALSLEAVLLEQRLKDADHARMVRWSPAWGMGLLATLGWRRFQVISGLLIRDLMFVTRAGPGVSLPETTSSALRADAQKTLLLATRCEVGPGLDVGVDLALDQPAALLVPPDASQPRLPRVLLVQGPGRVRGLPPGASALPILELRPSLGLRASRLIDMVIWAQYRRDRNAIGYGRAPGSPEIVARRVPPDFLGFGLAARAHF
ncbi:MAG TPA: hypothetical protein VGP93_02525 [Polyangiaceae bacterium]|nr:hypothetical protein [Polyangiaceae bacterium]